MLSKPICTYWNNLYYPKVDWTYWN